MIDDLTIANKKLKEENKRLRKAHHPHLAKDRLFEVTIHKMSAENRRLLEHKLREFAATLNESASGSSIQDSTKVQTKVNKSINSNSSSRVVDSAYSSMAHSGSMTSLPRDAKDEIRQGNAQSIQNYLQNIPVGHLPKQFAAMTGRQKKKLVVQRLEQLFTGKPSTQIDSDSQPFQQEQVSQSARSSEKGVLSGEGVREAHMLLTAMEIDSRPSHSKSSCNSEIHTSKGSAEASNGLPLDTSGQRPTRPLDLDPDRAQIPSENVDYLRHLGLSTPQLISEDSSDAEPDAQGWIYLNLLINMAQLHIVNVTPDYVRRAVQDVSEKFQISEDGHKLRWRGGSQGTHLSSDSGGNSGLDQSPNESDSICTGGGKRRKVNLGRFATIPTKVQRSHHSQGRLGGRGDVYYRPLFNHQKSFSDSSQASTSCTSISEFDALEYKPGHRRNQRSLSAFSPSGSQDKRRRDDGTMVFYSNARFCTDLSGDRDVPLPIHVTGVGEDGFSNHTRNALGCEAPQNRPPLSRTESGSLLAYRPFKGPPNVEASDTPHSTPDLLVYDVEDSNSRADKISASPYQAFEVCGNSGIRPEDHFAVHVNTRRTRASIPSTKLSKFSAPAAGMKRFHHHISTSSLASFAKPDSHDIVTEKLASLTTLTSPRPMRRSQPSGELPVQVEYMSQTFTKLEPSPLPKPIGYYGASTNSDDDSEYSGSSQNASQDAADSLRRSSLDPKTFHWTNALSGSMEMMDIETAGYVSIDANNAKEDEDESSEPANEYDTQEGDAEGEDEDEDEEDDDDDDDESIDMLAYLRATDPEGVAMREAEFEDAISSHAQFKPRSIVATASTSGSDESSIY